MQDSTTSCITTVHAGVATIRSINTLGLLEWATTLLITHRSDTSSALALTTDIRADTGVGVDVKGDG